MKALLEFSLPDEKIQFETAALAGSWQLLLRGLIKDLSDLCRTSNACQPTTQQIRWLLNHLEIKMRELDIGLVGVLVTEGQQPSIQPTKLEGIPSATLTFEQMEAWLHRPNQKYGMGKPINVICACGSMGAKLITQELETMEAAREAIRTPANHVQ